MRFAVVTMALLFIAAMIYLTVADFAENGVTGLGVVGVVVVGIVAIGTIGAFLQPPRRTNEGDRTRRAEPGDGPQPTEPGDGPQPTEPTREGQDGL
jgi:hypothetical protein